MQASDLRFVMAAYLNGGGRAMKTTYDEVYSRWLNDPENFWAEAAEAVHWQ